MPRKNNTPPANRPQASLPCIRKRRYATEREALEVAEYQMIMKPAIQLGVYLCPHCGKWHLTNIGKK